ncbi:hypothetical protein [Dyella choica]|uniref:Uncharacterized protein n=1 Tax=Dyella choica TaxID=1927959 RepID=A0A432M1R1_9GAMM|nr:hypothetical protein [Dyella choica]RUL71835.1 hypothetical protein EKH80_18235 [Dyella choica]
MIDIPPGAYESSPEPKPPGDDGSLGAGIVLAWVSMILGEIVLVPIGGLPLGLLLPVVIVVIGIRMLSGDAPRTGKGLLMGVASASAVILLLVAACFGLVSGIGENFR